MRVFWGILALACAVAVLPGVTAEAGGKGAVKTDLFVAAYPMPLPPNPRSRIVENPRIDVGDVIFNTNGHGVLNVTIKLKAGPPNTELIAFTVPRADPEEFTVTTNRKGRATLHFQRPIRDGSPDPLRITAIVRSADYTVAFRTEQTEVPLK